LAVTEAPPSSRLRRRTRTTPLILVVDDYEDTRRIYAEYLRFAGFRVEAANDGAEAVEKAKALTPDVVVMDLAMPNLDGWQATRELRGDPRTKDIYVLAVTGFSGEKQREEALRSGCDGVMTKPILPAELVRRIVGRLTMRAPLVRAFAGPRARPDAEADANKRSRSMAIGDDSD
jgi:CheY-like chemotaxis protein